MQALKQWVDELLAGAAARYVMSRRLEVRASTPSLMSESHEVIPTWQLLFSTAYRVALRRMLDRDESERNWPSQLGMK